MFTLKQATILALVGSAFAAPLAPRDGPYGRMPGSFGFSSGSTTVSETPTGTTEESVTVVTIYPNAGSGFNTPEAATPSAAPSASVSASASSGSTGSDDGYMSIVNKYRTAGGLSQLTQSSKLQANALKTAQDGNGQMKHELNPGSMAQVLAPGNANNFENVYVGGWLCEIPSLAGINCNKFSGGWSHDGQTGHAKILTDKGYSQIGCALADGIWACDLA